MPRDGSVQDGDDPEAPAAGHGGEHGALADAEDRLRGRLAALAQAGIAVAGDDEGIGRVLGDLGLQERDHRLDIGLALDAERPLGQLDAGDPRTPRLVESRHGVAQPGGHLRVGVRIDHENAAACHGRSCLPLLTRDFSLEPVSGVFEVFHRLTGERRRGAERGSMPKHRPSSATKPPPAVSRPEVSLATAPASSLDVRRCWSIDGHPTPRICSLPNS